MQLADPPLIAALASHLSYRGVEAKLVTYLELLERAISDLHLDASERQQLTGMAYDLGLTDAQIAQAHRRFVNELIDEAVDDDLVTPDEYQTLIRAASALDVDQKVVETRIRPYRESATAVQLTDGMTVVFTGDHPTLDKSEIAEHATSIGLSVQKGVSRATQLLAAIDPASTSGKATKARRYGIPVVAVADVLAAHRGDTLSATNIDGDSLIVITCPDCLSTWTADARSGAHRQRRCSECVEATQSLPRPSSTEAPARAATAVWAPPRVEWIPCQQCGATWHREVAQDRTPHLCPTCAGTVDAPRG